MNTPPRTNLPIVQRLVRAYELWHSFLPHIPKDARYTLGAKIDASLVDAIESVLAASLLPRERKLPALEQAARKLDLAKFFLQVAWELRALDNKKYATISEELADVGKMLGGWLRQFTSRN